MTEVIYKIYCKDETITDCYVGSTDNFNRRCGQHIKHIKNCNNENSKEYNYKVYKFIRQHGGIDNFIIEPIIECDEFNRYEAEVHYFLKLNSTLNSLWPRRSKKQYDIDNREKIKQYRIDNREQIKQYRLNNREHLLEQKKQYYIDNKELIAEKAKTKIECECGSLIRWADILRHKKTKKHQNYISTK
jgi:hypothetical protein